MMPAPDNVLIRLKSLSKHYGSHTVLDGIDLNVRSGEVLAIIGPSGSGKSTLLRCINYLEPPDGGTISIGSMTIDAARPVARAELSGLRRRVGMVFQSFNLFPHMSVLRNVSLAQERVLGRGRAEADERSMQLLKRVGLADKAGQFPVRCSGGQQLGLNRFDELRYVLLPQGLRVALPALLGFSILIFQGTSLCFTIALPELVSRAYEIGSTTFRYFPALLAAGVLYAVISIPAALLVNHVEKRAGLYAQR